MHEIRFVLRARGEDGGTEIVPLIDGESLVELVNSFEEAAGMQPAGDAYGGRVVGSFRFGPMDLHFLGLGGGRKTAVLGCNCGEWGCWPLLTRIDAGDAVVVWDRFEQPHRPARDYSGFPALRFGRRQYDAALAGLVYEIAALEGSGGLGRGRARVRAWK